DAVKFLLYYDVDEDERINNLKHVYMERVGAECLANDMPFFLEIVTYDAKNQDSKGVEYAKLKPRKVIEAMIEFSKEKYYVDVLKVEVPVNMNYV
ncbi:tagatose-bisphosphate aldolase, partial [Pseudomonas aeruginosa]